MIDSKEKHRIRVTRLLEDGSEVPFEDDESNKPIDCEGFVIAGMTKTGDNTMDSHLFLHNCGTSEIASMMEASDELSKAAILIQLKNIADVMSKFPFFGSGGGGTVNDYPSSPCPHEG